MAKGSFFRQAALLKALFLVMLLSMLSACDKTSDVQVLLMPEIYASAMGSVVINPRGHIIVVDFFDYTNLATRRIAPQLMSVANLNSDLRLIYRVVPALNNASIQVAKLAIAAEFQDKQRAFRDALLLSTHNLTVQHALGLAKVLGVDVNKLSLDANTLRVSEQIDENVALAHKLDIEQVPAFVVAYADDANTIVTANLLQGNVSIAQLKQMIAEVVVNANDKMRNNHV